MKKYILKSLLVLFFANVSFAQTTATDFTTDDCNGVTHNLFSELDAGNVIVICWVMPCGPCATYAGYASDAVQSFATSHPGRVKYYLADDYANSTCSYINGWALNYNIATDASFSTLDLSMSDYGAAGMPKAVVLGKNNYTVYCNDNDNHISQTGIEAAITLALSETTVGINDNQSIFSLHTFPNPANEFLNITYSLEEQTTVKFEVLNMIGEVVVINETIKGAGKHLLPLTVSDLSNGYYFLKLTTEQETETLRFTITN